MGAFVRCWRCDQPFKSWRNERLCSAYCARQLRSDLARGRACLVCGTPIAPHRRVDTRFCSGKCRQRAIRFLAIQRHFESVRNFVADDMRELREAWRRAEKANPLGYARTPLANRLRDEQQRIHALVYRRDYRECGQCGASAPMRMGQRYCSTRCRVAAHRARHARN